MFIYVADISKSSSNSVSDEGLFSAGDEPLPLDLDLDLLDPPDGFWFKELDELLRKFLLGLILLFWLI